LDRTYFFAAVSYKKTRKTSKNRFSGRIRLDLGKFVPKLRVSFRRHHTDRDKPEVTLAPPSQERDEAMRSLVKLMARQAAMEYLRSIDVHDEVNS
jgi:hypothetical protein